MTEPPLPLSLHVVTEDFSPRLREDALRALAGQMAAIIGADQEEAILRSAQEREELEPTYIGRGVAVPHARVAGLPGASILVAKSSRGIAWPEETAQLIVFLAVPEDRPDVYLQLLGGVMRWRHRLGLTQEQLLSMSPTDMEESLRRFLQLSIFPLL